MSKTLDYHERVKQCEKWGEEATNEKAKEVWRQMEQYWRDRAATKDAPLVPDEVDDAPVEVEVS